MKSSIWLTSLISMVSAMAALAQPTVQTVITNGLSEPYGVAIDFRDNHYISDSANNRILKYNPDSGSLTNLAGSVEGPGNDDGQGVFARFFNPQGLTYARNGVVVADSGNHRIRLVTESGQVSTLAGSTAGFADGVGTNAKFNAPTAVAADADGNIFVADLGNGRIRKIDLTNGVTTLASGFSRPAGVAVDRLTGQIYVADTDNHSIKVVDTDGSITLLAGGGTPFKSGYKDSILAGNALFNRPRGLLWVGGSTGLLVCDTDNHQVRRVFYNSDFDTFSVDTLVPSGASIFGKPVSMARDQNSNIAVADLGRNALLRIQLTVAQPPVSEPQVGIVLLTTNAFGELRTALFPVVNSTFNNDVVVGILAERGTDTFFSSDPNANFPDDPNSRNTPPPYENGLIEFNNTIVNPATDGPDVIIHAISAAEGRKSSTNVTAIFHFKVAGTVINGKNPGSFDMENATQGAELWYTTDGTPPVQGDPSVPYQIGDRLNIVNGTNNVLLRVAAFREGYTPSEVSKLFLYGDLQTSSIGLTRDFAGGIGSTIVVPIEAKLSTEDTLRSLQFRVEITPRNGGPAISSEFRNLTISTNDFIQIPLPSTNAPITSVYSDGDTTGLAVAYIGQSSGLQLKGAATVALLAIPIPPEAEEGQIYDIVLKEPSGTSDGFQQSVRMTPFASRTITVSNIPYLVGDTAPAGWYNQGGAFGDGNLNNNDVNNAFYASLGIFTPYSFTDAFDAMDAFPEDSETSVGGDGQIRFLDWQIILQRSLRRSTDNWTRSWSTGGARVTASATLNGAASHAAGLLTKIITGKAWSTQASLAAASVANAEAGTVVRVPVTLTVGSGYKIGGLQFRAVVQPEGSAPTLSSAARFVADSHQPAPIIINGGDSGLPLNQASAGWSLVPAPAFTPALKDTVILGSVEFVVPAAAKAGQSYTVRFANVDGAPDLQTQYTFESFAGGVWVQAAAPTVSSPISDEWKVRFFGSITSPLAAPAADPDGDGVSNLDEYEAGTNPADLRLSSTTGGVLGSASSLKIRWLGIPGLKYRVEKTGDLSKWTTAADNITGLGEFQEFSAGTGSGTQFYRVIARP